jgi:predicted nucleotidyltransferase
MEEHGKRADALAAELVEVYGDEVRSILVYGSAARGGFVEGASDINVMVLLDRLDVPILRRAAAPVRRWVEGGNPPPLFLSAEELRRSLDIFAIEYADIRDAHRVLHGDDPFASLRISDEHLRLQCERELKGALIQLREHLLLAGDDADAAGALLAGSLASLVVLFRTVARLTGGDAAADAESVVRAVAGRIDADAAPMLAALRARRGGEEFSPAPGGELVAGYVDAVARAVSFVDSLPTAPAP